METQWIGNSRDEACQQAALAAVKLRERYAQVTERWWDKDSDAESGFEYEGLWITDRTKSPCGRFDLTEEESLKTYGHPKRNRLRSRQNHAQFL